jgi:hypothetical protein
MSGYHRDKAHRSHCEGFLAFAPRRNGLENRFPGGMLSSWSMRPISAFFTGILLFAGCGGSVMEIGGAGATGGSAGAGTGGRGGRDAGRPDAKDSGGGGDATSDYTEDLNCPPFSEPPPERECDPFATTSGCARGEACYPFVDYPTGPCDREEYGTRCGPAGSGQQGDPCPMGRCSPRFVCVVTGQGNQCIELCTMDGPRDCAPGLVCQPIDVEGFGGCF